jgi:hypothetical protein
MYDEYAPLLIKMGYHPVPTSPPGFEPKKAPVRFVPALTKFVLFTAWDRIPTPIKTPQPGAGIGIRCGDSGVVALDYDDEEAAPIISEAFEASPVNKAGQRGWTSFYRADFDVPSENFYDAKGLVLQILSRGKQTVIPPSIHPDTKEPYRWTNRHSLYDTKPSDLPPLPRDYRERILKLGYTTTNPKDKLKRQRTERIDPETGEIENGFGDNLCAELNAIALKNLDKWVMDLGIHKLRKKGGRYPLYRGVAQWRQSTTGKALEERDANLSICGSGIKDFGDDSTYSALDLVMASRSCSLAEAFCWLEEKLLPQKRRISKSIWTRSSRPRNRLPLLATKIHQQIRHQIQKAKPVIPSWKRISRSSAPFGFSAIRCRNPNR